jgi:archaellin
MALRNTKGIMGIGTLIIFIATILVAAVAAAVIISTSNVLQQRSLLVGQEARKSITDAIEVVSILAASDSTTETFNNYEILVRLSPGSDPLQMRNFNLQYIAPNFDMAADLHYDDNMTVYEVDIDVVPGNNYTVYDLDGDGIDDHFELIINASGNNEGIRFYLTYMEDWSDVISIGRNIEQAGTAPVMITMDQQPIIYDGDHYGYVKIRGQTNADNTILASMNFAITSVPERCDFNTLQPESKFCFVVMTGNDDYVLSSGERFKLQYRTKAENEVSIGQDFMFIFTTEKGRLSEARARTPDVIISTKTKLWPLG